MSKVAKTASKNNPTSRQKAEAKFHNNVEVVPIKLIEFVGGKKISFMSLQNKQTKDVIFDDAGMPLKWHDVFAN